MEWGQGDCAPLRGVSHGRRARAKTRNRSRTKPHGRHRMEEFFVQGFVQASQPIPSRCCSPGWNTDSDCDRKVRRERCLTSNCQHRAKSCSTFSILYPLLCLSSITLPPNSHPFSARLSPGLFHLDLPLSPHPTSLLIASTAPPIRHGGPSAAVPQGQEEAQEACQAPLAQDVRLSSREPP
jgi:hypothetical protein